MTSHSLVPNEAGCTSCIAFEPDFAICLKSVQKLAMQLGALLRVAFGGSKESVLCQDSLLQENYLCVCAELSEILELDAADALKIVRFGPGPQIGEDGGAGNVLNGLASLSGDIEALRKHSKMLHALLQHTCGESGESFRRLGVAFQEPYIWACADLSERIGANVTTILADLGRLAFPRDSQESRGRLSAAISAVEG